MDLDAPSATEEPVDLPPELIREIADKVYQLLLLRLQIERERARLSDDEQLRWR